VKNYDPNQKKKKPPDELVIPLKETSKSYIDHYGKYGVLTCHSL